MRIIPFVFSQKQKCCQDRPSVPLGRIMTKYQVLLSCLSDLKFVMVQFSTSPFMGVFSLLPSTELTSYSPVLCPPWQHYFFFLFYPTHVAMFLPLQNFRKFPVALAPLSQSQGTVDLKRCYFTPSFSSPESSTLPESSHLSWCLFEHGAQVQWQLFAVCCMNAFASYHCV